MITESHRELIYREVEDRIPMWRPSCGRDFRNSARPSHPFRADPGVPADLAGFRQVELGVLRDRVLDQILFELHTVFELPAESSQVEDAVRRILENRYAEELACGNSGAYDAGAYARCLFFDRWNESIAGPEGADGAGREPSGWLTGLSHIQGAGFFRKVPQEILAWTRRFLEVESYHRMDPIRNDERLERYRVLRSLRDPGALQHFDDVLIWLELRLLGDSEGTGGDLGRLSREVAQELEGADWEVLLPDAPVQPALYILLRCHHLCLSETLDFHEEKRLLQIQANRQIDSLLDLMRLVLHKTTGEARLPEPSALLDQLQAEGFNVEHQRFRDPYEALLIPTADTERFEEAPLRLVVSLEDLSGDWERDRRLGAEQLQEWYTRLVREAVNDVEGFLQAGRQPLPQGRLIRRLVRVAATSVLARRAWPPQPISDELEDAVRKALPEGAVKHLVRPRKGYELKAKSDLSRLIGAEWSQQCEALLRIAAGYSIQGLHDYAHFIRYLLFQRWIERFGPDPIAWSDPLRAGELVTPEIGTMDWIAQVAARWSVDPHRAVPHSLEAVRDHLEEICPLSVVVDGLSESFVLSQGEKGRTYRGLLDELTPTCHRLLVAYGRARAGLGRLMLTSQWHAELESIIGFLAPSVRSLQEGARRRTESYLEDFAASLYRQQQRLFLRNEQEWKAFLTWEVHRWLAGNRGSLNEPGGPDRLLAHLETASARVDLPLGAVFTETVRSALIELISPAGASDEIPGDHMEAVLTLLPRLDCGACGRSSCRAFALSLATGRMNPSGCIRLAPHQVERVKTQLREIQRTSVSKGAENPLELLRDQSRWRTAPERHRFRNVLSVTEQKARQLLRERMKSLWERLNPKPRIFRSPSAEELYEGLCLYLGYEAAERLQRDERQLLLEHGDFRLDAEWEKVNRNNDWLVLARRRRQSQPLLRSQDPVWKAREAYQRVLFLHQLGPRDRELVLQRRFERYQEGFSHWWNEDLLDMNLAEFSIRDWEDFSKIIKNAYWHQESSLAGGRALSLLQEAGQRGVALMGPEVAPVQMLEAFLERLIRKEQAEHARKRGILGNHRGGLPVRGVGPLRELLEACVDEVGLGDPLETSEDRRKLRVEAVWKRFQGDGFYIAPDFSCTWEDLWPDEQDVIEEELARIGVSVSRSGRGAPVIPSWDQSLKVRSSFIRGLLQTVLERREQERMESVWLETKLEERSPGRPPLGLIRLLIRERVHRGVGRADIEEELKAHLGGAAAYPGLIDAWCEDLLHHLSCKRQYQLSKGIPALAPDQVDEDDMDSVLYRFPVFTSFLDRMLDRHLSMDRDRLLHYLFLVAKMEGNLDGLTALLREIRETSDVIEAAWLRFTEERLQEGPAPRLLPGAALGVPLLVSGLKEKEKEIVNQGLHQGMGRREKRPVQAAYRELIQVIRYHVLLQDDRHGSLEEVLNDIRRAGYDLGGLDEKGLTVTVERQWKRRESLREQKIWIYASVTARLLASQHAELQEADRAFQKIRMELLKDMDGGPSGQVQAGSPLAGLAQVVSRRGVALGQVKEEMYRRLSDLLEAERLATFHKRIRQIVEDLDRKRVEIHEGWYQGRIDPLAVFYLLRQQQKSDGEPKWDDFWRFVVDHGLNPLDELLASQRTDRQQRLRELDDRFQALLGISVLQWDQEVRAAARQDFQNWMEQQQRALAEKRSS